MRPVFRFALSAMDMEQRDYDSRTALHVAAAEGKPPPCPSASFSDLTLTLTLTRHSPRRFVLAAGHVEVVKFLLEACKVNPFPKDR